MVPDEPFILETKTKLFDFSPHQTANPQGEAEVFRWVNWGDFGEDSVTLPIDKIVAKMIKNLSH